MGTVIVFIASVTVIVGKVILINNFVGNSIVVGIGTKEGMIEVNTRINNDGAIVFSFNVKETKILPEFIKRNNR